MGTICGTRFVMCLALSVVTVPGLVLPDSSHDADITRSEIKRNRVDFLQKYQHRELRDLHSTGEGAALRHAISDLRDTLIIPTYICVLGALPKNQKHVVLFESSDFERWRFTVFTKDGEMVWPRTAYGMTFLADMDSVVVQCTVTNCFQNLTPDTLRVEVGSTKLRTFEQPTWFHYYALSPDGGLLLIRSILSDGRVCYGGGLTYTDKGRTPAELFMEPLLSPPLQFLEYDLEQNFRNDTIPQLLNRFMYLNCSELNAELTPKLKELHTSKRFERAVEKLMRHEHPWVRDAANYYLVHYGQAEN